jgi:dTDP-glucose 4,6-dehydratase
MATYVVTGGAGFIGSNLVHHLLAQTDARVVVLDALTYAANPENLAGLPAERLRFVHGDICDAALVRRLFAEERPDVVFHLAAESHVDRSIDGPRAFVQTNVTGTFELLEAARAFLADRPNPSFRFVHVSTDEVFGSLAEGGFFTEDTPYNPSSVYSASKAASDHLARAYHHTFGVPTIVTNCSNNYGPRQFPEKLIPLMILNALEGKPLPVYGDGKNIRDWLFVDDHCRALLLAARRGVPGQTYLVGGRNEWTNIDIVRTICRIVDERRPDPAGSRERLITYVKDRPGHDRRYAIDPSKIHRELGFAPAVEFGEGIERTVGWYLENQGWCDRVTSGVYRRERLGLGVSS